MTILQQFHFIRPEWFFALIPLALLSWILLRKKLFSHSWQSVIDPALLPHLLIGTPGITSRLPNFMFFVGGVIAIFALAGPVWEKLPQPVFKQQSAMVIVLDLSRSMDSSDIKPSRLTRARHKISDILNAREEGQTALIGYAADAFTISPLTDDTATIDSLVPSLNTDIMPAQGSRVDLALNKAAELLKNAGVAKGDILLITDGVSDQSQGKFTQHAPGHRISILGIGTEEGGPITLASGGFLKDESGSIVIPKLNHTQLRKLAHSAGGRFSVMSADDADIKHLIGLLDVNRIKSDNKETEMKADVWREEGPWLLLLLIPLTAYTFRKGYLSLLLFFVLPLPQPAHALSWDELWLNDNQRAEQQFEKNRNSEAARLFNQPEWKASAHYKAGEYEQALEQLEQLNHSEAHYNRGNTLAKMNRIDEAIDAYEHTLKTHPDHIDALHNKEQLEKQKQQQDDKKEQGDSDKDGKEKQDSDEQSKEKSDSSSQQNQSDKQQDGQKPDDQQDSQQKNEQNADKSQAENSEDNQDQKTSESEEKSQSDNEEQQESQSLSQAEKEDELSKQATEQWLRRVPDDPGGLLRNKFNYLYKQQKKQTQESQTW